MTKFTKEFLDTQNKVQLRELCRSNGIGYNGLNNDGMKLALLTVPGEGRVMTETEENEVIATEPNRFEQVTSEVAADIPLVPTPVVAPVVQAPVELPPVAPAPAKAEKVRKIQANRPEANGVKRPSEGTKCAQIWAWCDEVHKAGDKVTAKELRDALPALDDTTKTVQYYRWRKFNGIQGRQ